MNTYSKPVHWMLTWFDKRSEEFVGELVLPVGEDRIRQALGVAVGEPLDGEWLVAAKQRSPIEHLSGLKLDMEQFDYFVGAARVDG